MWKQRIQGYVSRRVVEFKAAPRRPASKVYFMTRDTWRRLRTTRIRLDQILCGGAYGMTGAQYGRRIGDLKSASMPIDASPHADFIRKYQKMKDAIFADEVFYGTSYYKFADKNIKLFGAYCSATTSTQVKYLARNFVNKYIGIEPDNQHLKSSRGFSEPDAYIRVRPVSFSNMYQLADGHHRAAIACVRGRKDVRVRVLDEPQFTCLQDLLLSVSWNANRRELYQPVNSPELGPAWALVRRCTDRLAMMQKFLSSRGFHDHQGHTYIDLACNYGWFVKAMHASGYIAQGLELDWAARQVGVHFYHLSPDQLIGAEATEFLASSPGSYDVVSCFSLMHHFVRGYGRCGADELLRMLYRVTRHILFFEMGDENEDWFRQSLAGWNPDTIREWLKKEAQFKEVTVLGRDGDRVPPFQHRYGRTLFACVK